MFAPPLNRRQALQLAVGSAFVPTAPQLLAHDDSQPLKIGACDWSLGLAGNPAALRLASEIGLDGVQVSFGEPGVGRDLRQAEVRRQYLEAANRHRVAIASLGMSILNREPLASVPETETWVASCVDAMPKLNVRIALLAFFGKGDIAGQPQLQAAVIRKLKRLAPQAEQAGVVLGIESWLSAEDHLRILDSVASPAVQVYYDVANMTERGYDIFREIRLLGRERICEVHCKENGSLLGQGQVDFPKLQQVLGEIGYRGWLIMEGAVPKGRSIRESYALNQKYLRSVFAALKS